MPLRMNWKSWEGEQGPWSPAPYKGLSFPQSLAPPESPRGPDSWVSPSGSPVQDWPGGAPPFHQEGSFTEHLLPAGLGCALTQSSQGQGIALGPMLQLQRAGLWDHIRNRTLGLPGL